MKILLNKVILSRLYRDIGNFELYKNILKSVKNIIKKIGIVHYKEYLKDFCLIPAFV